MSISKTAFSQHRYLIMTLDTAISKLSLDMCTRTHTLSINIHIRCFARNGSELTKPTDPLDLSTGNSCLNWTSILPPNHISSRSAGNPYLN
jgi:hypothetical protein